jgi:hypothetical protein
VSPVKTTSRNTLTYIKFRTEKQTASFGRLNETTSNSVPLAGVNDMFIGMWQLMSKFFTISSSGWRFGLEQVMLVMGDHPDKYGYCNRLFFHIKKTPTGTDLKVMYHHVPILSPYNTPVLDS